MRNIKKILCCITVILFLLMCYKICLLMHEISEQTKIISETEQNTINIPYKKYMGKFTATFYCSCPKCVGHKKQVKTAVGNIPYPNKTIAVDKNVIPLHSIVYIKDMGFYVAEDTGGAIKGNKIDIFVNSHETALKLGKKTVEIYILN